MAVHGTALRMQAMDNVEVAKASIPPVSQMPSVGTTVLIDSAELARRLQVPESWVRNRTRARTPKEERIPCVRLGRYVRFCWDSRSLQAWIGGRMA
jgi:hypothetical protein